MRPRMQPHQCRHLLFGSLLVGGALVASLVVATHCASAEPPAKRDLQLDDFAFAREVSPVEGVAVYSAEIPDDVYRMVVRRDLGDLRVFNEQGRVVPHEIEQAPLEAARLAQVIAVPFFPIQGEKTPGKTDTAVRVQQDAAGKVVQVQFSGSEAPSQESASRWYLLDLRSLKNPLTALTLRVTGLESNRISPVQVEASSDLDHWQPVGASGVLARLSYEGQDFERSRIEFSSPQSHYLRIQLGQNEPIILQSVTGESVEVSDRLPSKQWRTPRGVVDEKEPQVVYFDAESAAPIRSFKLGLPVLNSVALVRIDSRSQTEVPWTERFSGKVYRLASEGTELETPAQEFASPVVDRYWRVAAIGKDNAFGGDLPTLSVGWRPARVVFLAQGQGPFLVAYGSALASAPDFGMTRLASTPGVKVADVSLGEPITLGGPEKRVPQVPAPEVPWKKYVLWGLLVGFLLIVAGMAHRLWKDLKKA